MSAAHEVVLLRHAETEWSLNGRHTGRTDLPLTEHGCELARELAPRLAGRDFAAVLCSPLRRARETCELAGLADGARAEPALMEWDYGDYEGLTSAEIEQRRPGWSLWADGCPGGEDAAAVGRRVDAVIEAVGEIDGDVALLAHGHVLRVLGARWIELEPARGARLLLSTGAISVLGHEHGTRALASWNALE
ncbi:MAG: histidine phosphatase family protein [Solirubrobacteraceae bacterium]